MIGIRVTEQTKALLQELAQEEHRTLANYVRHIIGVFLKEHKGIDLNATEGLEGEEEE